MNKKTLSVAIIISLILTSAPMISGETNNQITHEIEVTTDSNNKTEYYAIIAACSKYNDSNLNLPKFLPPHKEWKLKTFYNTLIDADNWKEENVILLINQQATIENITNAFDQMADIVDENDVFLFSWQGHGSKIRDIPPSGKTEYDEEDEFDEIIAPYNCYIDENGFIHNYISDDKLNRMFSNINSKGQFIIFDCCYSGGIIKDLEAENRVLVALTKEDNLGLIDLVLGFPMTMSLSLGLKNNFLKNRKDKNDDGFLSAEEVFTWCKPIINIATHSWFIESFIITLFIYRIIYKDESSPIVKALFSTVLGHLIAQMVIHKKTGDFAKNSPHMIDNYDGELNIIQL